MASAKKQTKKDLENRIAELEAKLNQLSAKLESKSSEIKPTPKQTEITTPPPVTFQAALEDAYYNSKMSSFHDYRAKVPGYSPAPNRYFVRTTSPVGRVPTSNWNDQKTKVTGYTQPSNQYFATRARLAYHPPDKTFGSFSGVNMSIEGIEIKAQTPEPEAPKPEAPKPSKGTLPKGF